MGSPGGTSGGTSVGMGSPGGKGGTSGGMAGPGGKGGTSGGMGGPGSKGGPGGNAAPLAAWAALAAIPGSWPCMLIMRPFKINCTV